MPPSGVGSASLVGPRAEEIQRDRERDEKRSDHREMTDLRGGQAELGLGHASKHDRGICGHADRDDDGYEINSVVQGGTVLLRSRCSATERRWM